MLGVAGCGDPGCEGAKGARGAGARRGPVGQGLISWWGPCPLEVPGRPKCGQGPRHKSRPCPSEPYGWAVLMAVKRRRGQGGHEGGRGEGAAKMTRGTQGGRYREGPGRSASSERVVAAVERSPKVILQPLGARKPTGWRGV